MLLESVGPQFALFTLSGLATFEATERLEAEILAEADLSPAVIRPSARPSPTTFHVAVSESVPIGVATSTVGPLAELPLGLLLASRGIDPTALDLLDATCELVNVSVDGAAAIGIDGVTEALYRSCYHHAKRAGAQSLVVGVDPWIYDVLREQYGIPFRVLGAPVDALGRELLAIGGRIDELEEGIRRDAPEFFAYLELPFGDQAVTI